MNNTMKDALNGTFHKVLFFSHSSYNIDRMHMPEEQSEVSTRPDHLCYDIENNRWAVEESENCKN